MLCLPVKSLSKEAALLPPHLHEPHIHSDIGTTGIPKQEHRTAVSVLPPPVPQNVTIGPMEAAHGVGCVAAEEH